jgi:hypothetical protein
LIATTVAALITLVPTLVAALVSTLIAALITLVSTLVTALIATLVTLVSTLITLVAATVTTGCFTTLTTSLTGFFTGKLVRRTLFVGSASALARNFPLLFLIHRSKPLAARLFVLLISHFKLLFLLSQSQCALLALS